MKQVKQSFNSELALTLNVAFADYSPSEGTVRIVLPANEIQLHNVSGYIGAELEAQGVSRLDTHRIVDAAIRAMERELLILALTNSIERDY